MRETIVKWLRSVTHIYLFRGTRKATARRFEQAGAKPSGWLDTDHAAANLAQAPPCAGFFVPTGKPYKNNFAFRAFSS